MKKFSSYAEYESWTDTFENPSDYEEIPVAIDDGWKISIDMFTACKSYKTGPPAFWKDVPGGQRGNRWMGRVHERDLRGRLLQGHNWVETRLVERPGGSQGVQQERHL